MTEAQTACDQTALPTVAFGERRITRLLVGGNPFRGNSHQSPEKDREMLGYYTVERTKSVLRDCERLGINTVQARGDVLIQACMREHWAEGGKLQFIAQTASELRDLRGHVRQLADFGAIGIYVHGTYTDQHFQDNAMQEVHDLLQAIRDTGVQAGVGTHIPEVIDYVEEKGWLPDFYMTSLCNISRTKRESALVTGRYTSGEVFDYQDRYPMFERIRATLRPCLVFKLFGAGRFCTSPEQVSAILAEAYGNIKASDALVIGMFPKHHDEIAENAQLARMLLNVNATYASPTTSTRE